MFNLMTPQTTECRFKSNKHSIKSSELFQLPFFLPCSLHLCSFYTNSIIRPIIIVIIMTETKNVQYTHIYTGQKLSGDDVKAVRIDSNITTIQEDAFHSCQYLTVVDIPNSITSIESNAFYKCSSLKSISIPSSVETIGLQAFACCSSIEDVNIPSSLTEISPSTFEGCKKLKSITIPSSVDWIGEYAFRGCSILENVSVLSSTEIDATAFRDCPLNEQSFKQFKR